MPDRIAEFDALYAPDRMAQLRQRATRFLNRSHLRDLDDIISMAIASAWAHRHSIKGTVEGYVMGAIRLATFDLHNKRKHEVIVPFAPKVGHPGMLDTATIAHCEENYEALVVTDTPETPILKRERKQAAKQERSDRYRRMREALKPSQVKHFESWVARGFISNNHAEACADSKLRQHLFAAFGTTPREFKLCWRKRQAA
jgi:hypothetical protein